MDWQGELRDLMTGAPVNPGRRCQYCATPLESNVACCPHCGEDLSGLSGRPPLNHVYYREALDYYEATDLSRALESVDLCLRLVPEYAPALRLSAGISALVGRLERASSHAARLLALVPTHPADLRLAGAIQAARGESHRAPISEHAMTDTTLTRDTRLACPRSQAGARPSTRTTVLAAVVGGAGLAALVQWAISRSCRNMPGGDRASS